MNVKKFVAPTARDALHKVKEVLGPEAIILSNRGLPGGALKSWRLRHVTWRPLHQHRCGTLLPASKQSALPQSRKMTIR